ncbi:hypothetical protein QBC45DRAFT_421511 [Copromyces sp. CBS 386.78]|nr:hypothetical protein QBC45DRAFT_421511 [Copromyces sp. CBS 386.78]
MFTSLQHRGSDSSATPNTSAVAIDDLEITDEHTLAASSESASLRGTHTAYHPERDEEDNRLSQTSDSLNTAGREPPSLSITSSMSSNASATEGTPMNNLSKSTARAARTTSYVTESQAWYSRLRPVESNNGIDTTHGLQELAARLAPISASLEGLSPQRDDARTAASVLYPIQIREGMDMLVGETSEDDGVEDISVEEGGWVTFLDTQPWDNIRQQ